MYPSVVPLTKWCCDTCGITVTPIVIEFAKNKFRYEPVSKYWHAGKKVIYCSPTFSIGVV